MPTYEYACTGCGHRLEAVQSFTDDPLTTCPECGEALRKVYGAVGIVLKGSGFYKTDSRAASSSSSSADASSNSKSSSTTESKGSSESKAASTKSESGNSKSDSGSSKSESGAKAATSSSAG